MILYLLAVNRAPSAAIKTNTAKDLVKVSRVILLSLPCFWKPIDSLFLAFCFTIDFACWAIAAVFWFLGLWNLLLMKFVKYSRSLRNISSSSLILWVMITLKNCLESTRDFNKTIIITRTVKLRKAMLILKRVLFVL